MRLFQSVTYQSSLRNHNPVFNFSVQNLNLCTLSTLIYAWTTDNLRFWLSVLNRRVFSLIIKFICEHVMVEFNVKLYRAHSLGTNSHYSQGTMDCSLANPWFDLKVWIPIPWKRCTKNGSFSNCEWINWQWKWL